MPYTYPPLWALVCAPLGWLPTPVATAAFWLSAAVACGWLLRLVAPRGPGAWVWVALAVLSAPIGRSLYLGQVNPFVVGLLVADALVLPTALRGAATGLAAAVKVTPAFLALPLLTERDWRSLARCVGTFAAVTAAAAVVLPEASRAYWGQLLWQADRVGDAGYPDNQSLLGLFTRLVEPPTAVLWARAAVVIVAVVCWRAVRTQQHAGAPLAALAAAGLGSVLISPVSWSHHWVWLLLVSALVWPNRRYSFALLAPLVLEPLQVAQLLKSLALPATVEALLVSLPTLTGLGALLVMTRLPLSREAFSRARMPALRGRVRAASGGPSGSALGSR